MLIKVTPAKPGLNPVRKAITFFRNVQKLSGMLSVPLQSLSSPTGRKEIQGVAFGIHVHPVCLDEKQRRAFAFWPLQGRKETVKRKEHLFCLLLHLWDPRTYLLKQCHIKAGISLVAALKATVKAQMSSRGNITLNPESVNEFIKGARG